jgi:hypothetical protein
MWKDRLIVGFENVLMMMMPILCLFSYTFVMPVIIFYASKDLIHAKFKISKIINSRYSLPFILTYSIVITCSIIINLELYHYILLYIALIISFTSSFKINSDQYRGIEIGSYIALIFSIIITLYDKKYLIESNHYHIFLILLFGFINKSWHAKIFILSIISLYLISCGNVLNSKLLYISVFTIFYHLIFLRYKIASRRFAIFAYFAIMITSMINYKYADIDIYKNISSNIIFGNGIMQYKALKGISPNVFLEILYDYGAVSYSLFCIAIFGFALRIAQAGQSELIKKRTSNYATLFDAWTILIVIYLCNYFSLYDINQIIGIFCITILLRSYK